MCDGDGLSCDECSELFPNSEQGNACNPDSCDQYADCAGECGGGAVVDDCGVCGGDNSANTGICDCNGVPNGGAEYDVCGVCGGDNSSCGGCLDENATNYNAEAAHSCIGINGYSSFSCCEYDETAVRRALFSHMKFYFSDESAGWVLQHEFHPNITTWKTDNEPPFLETGTGFIFATAIRGWESSVYEANQSITSGGILGGDAFVLDVVPYQYENLSVNPVSMAGLYIYSGENIELSEVNFTQGTEASIEFIDDPGQNPKYRLTWLFEGGGDGAYHPIVDLNPLKERMLTDSTISHFSIILLPYIYDEFNVENWEMFIYEIRFPISLCSDLGDLNGDGGHNVLDIVTLANCILNADCATLEYGCAGDMNGDGGYNVLDIVTLANCILSANCDDLS